jgi:hypothetical protein
VTRFARSSRHGGPALPRPPSATRGWPTGRRFGDEWPARCRERARTLARRAGDRRRRSPRETVGDDPSVGDHASAPAVAQRLAERARLAAARPRDRRHLQHLQHVCHRPACTFASRRSACRSHARAAPPSVRSPTSCRTPATGSTARSAASSPPACSRARSRTSGISTRTASPPASSIISSPTSPDAWRS